MPDLPAQSLRGWQADIQEIKIRSTADQTDQPALTWSPKTEDPQPLLVALHTWSGGYSQVSNGPVYAQWCMDRGWHFIAPDFRGPNMTPAAMGSDLAVQDIVDAVEHMKKTHKVDASRIYLIGVSGGGHMAMQMAGRHPEIWAGVSAWCGISDIAAWHTEHVKQGRPDKYAQNIEASLGGPPVGEALAEAMKRSPLTHLARAKAVPLDINHGLQDGRTGSVPFRHSLLAFNRVAEAPLPEAEILQYYETLQIPASWPVPEPDPLYVALYPPGSKRPGWMPGSPETRLLNEAMRVPKPVVFRQVSGQARITIFDGGHEILYTPALNWLAAQKKGQPAVWKLENPIVIGSGDTQSGL
ncbi:alpha/beta fold hydrolase [Prosthecobacter sp. SYSU 5D2]|uniref:alpha/beta hydrolase family protein n=1 Tax=Prosthecobacter sp. SYSU 5D2 TaxID=3134134 RepID=UPI0031FEDE7E